MRAQPGSYGFVGANGGVLSKYSAGVYSTTTTDWRPDDSQRLQAKIDSWSAPPVIAAVNGFAIGGGFEIALACHLVVADSTAVFALPEVKVGLIAGAGGIVRLPRALPRKLAAEMILTGRRMTAAEALSFGLVNRVRAG
jgi:enoyl-CoA hydratase/carnithine racemase